jgi:chlorite dismutase
MSTKVCPAETLPIPADMIPTPIPGTLASSATDGCPRTTAMVMWLRPPGWAADDAAVAVQSRTPASTTIAAVPARTFAKFTFFKLDPAWQRRDLEARAEDKREFLAACEDFSQDRSLRAYSTVGTRGDTDLLLLSQSPILDDIHTFHVVLAQSGLAKWMTTPHSYLAMTKRSPYSEAEARPEICTSERRYLFVYPFEKKREWYRLPADERQRIMQNHIEVGREYPEITINTAYSFGLDDQEFVVSFEADDPGQFLELVQELRGTESSSYTLRDTPIFTCVAMSVGKALDALDGAATARGAPALA